LEVLSPEKRRRAITLAQFHLFYFSGYSTSKMHFGSTVPGKIVSAYRGRALAQFHLFLFFRVQYFHFVIFPERILEVLFPEKRRRESSLSRASAPALIAGERSSAGPILPFFIFPGTVLPFFYFSVVRKVPEKPVLFLPHPFIIPWL
jgi:hypothetical protein